MAGSLKWGILQGHHKMLCRISNLGKKNLFENLLFKRIGGRFKSLLIFFCEKTRPRHSCRFIFQTFPGRERETLYIFLIGPVGLEDPLSRPHHLYPARSRTTNDHFSLYPKLLFSSLKSPWKWPFWRFFSRDTPRIKQAGKKKKKIYIKNHIWILYMNRLFSNKIEFKDFFGLHCQLFDRLQTDFVSYCSVVWFTHKTYILVFYSSRCDFTLDWTSTPSTSCCSFQKIVIQ